MRRWRFMPETDETNAIVFDADLVTCATILRGNRGGVMIHFAMEDRDGLIAAKVANLADAAALINDVCDQALVTEADLHYQSAEQEAAAS